MRGQRGPSSSSMARLFNLLALLFASTAALHVARSPLTARKSPAMCAVKRTAAGVDIEHAADDVRKHLSLELVQSFVAATEAGDAAAAMTLCTDDFYYATHRATTETLAAAEERLHTKTPAPSKVTEELHEKQPGLFVRQIVVKPIPFITVAVRQEFEIVDRDGGVKLRRAEYIKL